MEDGKTEDGSIDPNAIEVRIKQLNNATDVKAIRSVQSLASSTTSFLKGKRLLEGSDCYACHAMKDPSVGPSLIQISDRYQKEEGEVTRLAQSILKGSTGIWGERLMSAHPQHSEAEAIDMVQYILAISQAPEKGERLDLAGSISTNQAGNEDLFVLSAAYEDKGANGQASITREVRKIFRPTLIPAVAFDFAKRIKAKPYNEDGGMYAEVALNGCFIGFKEIDLSGVRTIRSKIRSTADWVSVEVRQGSPEGKLLDKQRKELGFKEDKWAPYNEADWFFIDLSIPSDAGRDDLYFVFNSSKLTSEYIYYDICQVHSFEFLFENL